MTSIPKNPLESGMMAALKEVNNFSKRHEEIRSHKGIFKSDEETEKKFDSLLNNLMELRNALQDSKAIKGKASRVIDEEMREKIASALSFFESPSKIKRREEKMRVLQGTLFWEKLFGFQTLLENLQDERLKRGRRVERIDNSGSGKQGG
ncbi:hypothetical protein [Estrella lausannensis]|uniref:Uncharacterized protein n=1 Tax=Estrella lausannensis TaxID=483423 RepID=A0A0H5E5Z9_9BACT|nr:hypothetical protein [Estrella lausannensis]CRX38665.1 Conserved hypothetical protein [Estrella lausannensis]